MTTQHASSDQLRPPFLNISLNMFSKGAWNEI